MARKRVLIACHNIILSGGLFRFERFGREISELGHELSYLHFADTKHLEFKSQFDVISFDHASTQTWDVTMVPGQGFPDATKQAFAQLTSPRFGLRVQHVLNDRIWEPGFLAVNRHFKPDIVIFNNRHWEPGSFTTFSARKFYFLEGAVDLRRFAPAPRTGKAIRESNEKWIIGTHAKPKSLSPILDSLALLPDHVEVRVFGAPPQLGERHQGLISSGQLHFAGRLNERELLAFYHECDCIVHADSYAGWANMAAESMACGIPVICTKHGTLAFAEHAETALLIDEPKPETIATAVRTLMSDDQLRSRMVTNARNRIASFSWTRYASDLMTLCDDDNAAHYTYAPELGLHAKWPLASRLESIAAVLEVCPGKTVLDLGCAEGLIAQTFLEKGAASVHGFEYDEERVRESRHRSSKFPQASLRIADLSDWPQFVEKNADILLKRYDIILYLRLHHHLPRQKRSAVLDACLSLTDKCLVIRTPNTLWDQDNLEEKINVQGFDVERQVDATLTTQGSLGICWRRS